MLLCMGVVPFFLSRPVGLLFLGIEKIKKERERERRVPPSARVTYLYSSSEARAFPTLLSFLFFKQKFVASGIHDWKGAWNIEAQAAFPLPTEKDTPPSWGEKNKRKENEKR